MIFHEEFFLSYIPLTDLTLLSDWCYFLRYRGTCVLQLFVSQVKKSRQKFKYLEDEKKF